MPRILVVYASNHGHTARIAARIADVLEQEPGVAAELRDVTAKPLPDPAGYDAVVAGGSIHMGRHQPDLVAWARRHARPLNQAPSYFFSSCLAIADDTDDARAHAREWIDDFADDTGWTPRRAVTFAGALQYREYDRMTRLFMRLLMARGHHPTDTRQDVDYTDWDAVDAFARDIAREVVRDAVPA